MRRYTAAIASLLAVAALSLTAGCSSSPRSDSPASSAATDSTARKLIRITFAGGRVTPVAEKVDVTVGQPVVLDITADTAGEIHVHSTPEQHVEYVVGHTQVPIGSFNFPTQIEVESHSLDKTILILQVH